MKPQQQQQRAPPASASSAAASAHTQKQPQSQSQLQSQPQSQSQSQTQSQAAQARDTLNVLHQMSLLLGSGLEKDALAACVALCELGANPEALAAVVKELRREFAT
ncbi:hypothetical protein HDU83_005040 [Entophlyctis luteolus]|nr:hypothetical protein HDU83_005040 [Entophlyctis luteolus]